MQHLTTPRPNTIKAPKYYTTTYAAPTYYTKAPKYYSAPSYTIEEPECYTTTYAAPSYYTKVPKYNSAPSYYTEVAVYNIEVPKNFFLPATIPRLPFITPPKRSNTSPKRPSTTLPRATQL
jgi:hypothetical protein